MKNMMKCNRYWKAISPEFTDVKLRLSPEGKNVGEDVRKHGIETTV